MDILRRIWIPLVQEPVVDGAILYYNTTRALDLHAECDVLIDPVAIFHHEHLHVIFQRAT